MRMVSGKAIERVRTLICLSDKIGAGMVQWCVYSPSTNVARTEFVVGSLPCSVRFISRYSSFLSNSTRNGQGRTTYFMLCLAINQFYLYI